MTKASRSLILFVFVVIFVVGIVEVDSRRHRRMNEITIHNHAEANIKIRCQSIKTDMKDRFLGPMTSYQFHFYDIDRGDLHFWCDASGLFGFFESFDVFGRTAESGMNQTWFIKNDGLYASHELNRVVEWQWIYPPFDSYAIESLNSVDLPALPQWVPF